jgi:hypothetical protein
LEDFDVVLVATLSAGVRELVDSLGDRDMHMVAFQIRLLAEEVSRMVGL